MRAFLAMGGYWAYVWPAWALAVGILAGLYAISTHQARRAERRLAALGRQPRVRTGGR
jgi:heme exporter protein D